MDYFYEELIPQSICDFDPKITAEYPLSLTKLMLKEVINEETRRLIREYYNKNNEASDDFEKVLNNKTKLLLEVDCRGRLYTQKDKLKFTKYKTYSNDKFHPDNLKIIRIGNFKRVYSFW